MSASRRLFVVSTMMVTASCSLFVSVSGLEGGSDAGSSDATTTDSSNDASTDSGDAGSPVKMCDPTAPFEQVNLFPVKDGFNDYRMSLTDDELESWFATNLADGGPVTYPIQHGTRSAPDASFSFVDETAVYATDPAISGDGLRLFYAYFGPIGSFDIGVATRAGRTVAFPSGLVVGSVDTASSEFAPFLSSDGALWFCSDRARDAGDYNSDIYRAASNATTFDAPVLVSELSEPLAGELGVVLSNDLLTVYVTSSRTDPTSLGQNDIFRATRATVSDAFGPVSNVTELNSAASERATWISPDNCRLYFESGRSSLTSIYLAEKTPPQ